MELNYGFSLLTLILIVSEVKYTREVQTLQFYESAETFNSFSDRAHRK